MLELPVLKNNPPLKRKVEKGLEEDLPSPMDPPEAYAPPSIEQIPLEKMALPLRQLMGDHEHFLKILSDFDQAFVILKQSQWVFNSETSKVFKDFFRAMDQEIATHTQREEKFLFPILREKLLAAGEHSPMAKPVTPVDVMEADHQRVEQTTSLVFNLLGLAPRMKCVEDRNFIFELAFQQGQEIVEVLKLHIYKENTILFPLAQRLLSEEEFHSLLDTSP